ncbi:hypothetical protein B0H13DRAFT_1850714 [Mycena leptocephala]|nr:hypothetical protein B0H13DRAFT_1850714 [Mycena leptocephala]
MQGPRISWWLLKALRHTGRTCSLDEQGSEKSSEQNKDLNFNFTSIRQNDANQPANSNPLVVGKIFAQLIKSLANKCVARRAAKPILLLAGGRIDIILSESAESSSSSVSSFITLRPTSQHSFPERFAHRHCAPVCSTIWGLRVISGKVRRKSLRLTAGDNKVDSVKLSLLLAGAKLRHVLFIIIRRRDQGGMQRERREWVVDDAESTWASQREELN